VEFSLLPQKKKKRKKKKLSHLARVSDMMASLDKMEKPIKIMMVLQLESKNTIENFKENRYFQ